ncbi:tetratricopeptide repeat protein [Glycomyces dulcitolivorans]|uniref:tetratricopeptide repeat protein n=1 Tax=Glycomyces dulcitolivorans TaxID=2200759 RepID=UPI000DD4C397|nr:tetratricopeptide repeat protein [Glycomyces dulcitolivorans]
MDADPKRTLAEHLQSAEMLYDLGQVPDARAETDAALRLDPLDPDANAMAAACALADNDPDEALVYAGAALARTPGHRRAMITRGYALADSGRREEAMQAAASLLELDRASWLHHIHYALITRRAGAAQPALDAAWNAVNLAPDQPRTHRTLAAIAEDLGMDDLAKRSRRAAADLDPDGIEAHAPALPPEARRMRRRLVDADKDDPAWREKMFGAADETAPYWRRYTPFQGPVARSALLGVAVVFAVPALLGSEIDTGARLFFAVVAVAAWVGWFTVLRRHRRTE